MQKLHNRKLQFLKSWKEHRFFLIKCQIKIEYQNCLRFWDQCQEILRPRVVQCGWSRLKEEIYHTRRNASTDNPRRAYPRLFVRDVLRGRVTKLDGDEFPTVRPPDIPGSVASARVKDGTSRAIGMPARTPVISARMLGETSSEMCRW